ncbi:MAG: hypothetical protein EOO07_07970 [Chitinophagaceae bacterium]|nr:MAG: hypothetical protein EOO07_07970 [Chitinophagaceae bacterium]
MERVSSLPSYKNAKLCLRYSLAFLVLFFCSNCHRPWEQPKLIWEDHKAIGIAIPKNNQNYDSLKITRSAVDNVPIFGSFIEEGDRIEFRSAIPLTAGLSYDIWSGTLKIGRVDIPYPNQNRAPVLSSIYPEADTVPENLLKFYFVFSKPMRSGESLQHIFLLDKKGDTMRNVFLNLQPELWDTSGKILTIWIDPGRIKRDLVLNKKLGNPLHLKSNYKLIVSSRWKDKQGLALTESFTKSFVVGAADHEVPNVHKWTLSLPKLGTRLPIVLDTEETLDHLLLAESISISDSNGQELKGAVKIKKDQLWEFTPVKPWTDTTYQLEVNARLEDLAANNLNKVFDRDIRTEKSRNDEMVKREFRLMH